MNFKVLFFSLSFFLIFPLSSSPTIYGKLKVTIESQELIEETKTELVSNSSRLGLKGNIDLSKGLEGIYQAEYEIDPVDGTADESKDRTLKQRNSFVGLKGEYGTLFVGTYDTAFKNSQNKIDLFNDLAGDIQNIFHGENRMKDFLGYTSPTLGGGFSVTLNAIKGTTDPDKDSIGDSKSYSLSYKTQLFFSSIAVDSSLKGYDSTRFSLQIPLNKNQVGFIYQKSKKVYSEKEENGFVVSLSRKIINNGTLKLQIAKSDMKIKSGKQISLGYDYDFNQQVKLLLFFTDLSGDSELEPKEIFALGFEYNF